MVLSEFMSGLRLEAHTLAKRPDVFQVRGGGEIHEYIPIRKGQSKNEQDLMNLASEWQRKQGQGWLLGFQLEWLNKVEPFTEMGNIRGEANLEEMCTFIWSPQ